MNISIQFKQIKWIFDGNHPVGDDEAILFATIDGTHCKIFEPRKDPGSKWYSHKFNGPGLTYELVIHVHTQKLLWVNGPYEAGMSDLQVARQPDGILAKIPDGRKIIADKAYRGESNKFATPNEHDTINTAKFKGRARARHETYNKRIKDYQIIRQQFRNNLIKHKTAFEAVCILVQYDIEHGNPLFET
jgi:DDE superfamily endonuclease